MNNNNFVSLFKRLHPSLNVVIQKDRPSQLPVGYRYLELKTSEQGLAYFNKGIFRFQETPDGFKKLVFTKNINGQLLEEVILKDKTLCRKFYNGQGKPKVTFFYKNVSGCIREEILDVDKGLVERSIYRPNSQNDIDFPEIHFRGKLSHYYPAYLLEDYKISFAENCTRSIYDDNGILVRQEIHKDGKIVKIKQKQNCFSRLFRQSRAKVSYAENTQGDARKQIIERFKGAWKDLPHADYVQTRHDNISFYRTKYPKQR